MIKSKRKTKYGFSLIELIIVLAVMAIIALIAIPNFTAVRENSKNKADQQSMEVIKRIMIVAQTDIDIPNGRIFDMHYDEDGVLSLNWDNEDEKPTGGVEEYLLEQFKEVKEPQGMSTKWTIKEKATTYHVEIGGNGEIRVDTFDSKTIGKSPIEEQS